MHLKRFFQIPSEIRAEFWQDTLRKNHLSLQVICIIIFAMESLNMFRVLFRSSSGLGTLNNRIYFTMYLLLWMSAAIYLFLWRLLRRCSPRRRWFAQYGTVLFALLWHAGLNAYDLMRNSDAEITVIVTSMLAISVFIQMPIAHSIVAYGLSYGLFMGLAGGLLSGGRLVNLTITTIVSMAVSMTSFRHAVVTVSQHKKIDKMNQKLQELSEKYGVSKSALAVAWILRHPAKIQTIVGTTNRERLADICTAGDIQLSREDWYQIYLAAGNQLP